MKHSGKRSICVLIATMMIVAMWAPGMGMVENSMAAESVSVSDENSLITAINNAGEGQKIEIQKSIQLSKILDIPARKSIVLAGKNGSEKLTIALSSSAYRSVRTSKGAMIKAQGKLAIEELTLDGENNLRVLSVSAGGDVTLDSGAVIANGALGNEVTNYGGAGIFLEGSAAAKARLTINSGAAIKNNKAQGEPVTGIGICDYRYSDIVMNGGEITGNTDLTTKNSRYFSYGGGIAIQGTGSSFSMNGGKISNNIAKAAGGGIYVQTGSGHVIKGGEISGNQVNRAGAGIYVGMGAAIEMNGGRISGNTASSDVNETGWASGGGVFADGPANSSGLAGRFTLKGGTITGNTAKTTAKTNANGAQFGQGGGVMAAGEFVMEGGTIKNNAAEKTDALSGDVGCGAGVSVKGGLYPGIFTMSGGQITENKASGQGGAVYMNNKLLVIDAISTTNSSFLQPGSGSFNLSGNVQISGNTAGGKNNNIYLTRDSVLTITDELKEQAALNLSSEVADEGTIVGKAGEDYDISAEDARKMLSDEGKKIYAVNAAGKVVISKEHSGNYQKLTDSNTTVKFGGSHEYTGTAIKPIPTVQYNDKELQLGQDYTVSYKSSAEPSRDNINVSAGGVVRVIGAGDYQGTLTKTFEISPKPLDGDGIVIDDISNRIQIGAEKISPKIRARYNGIVLKENEDFVVVYSNNDQVGQANATITGRGNYTGQVEKSFQIEAKGDKKIAQNKEELQEEINAATAGTETTLYILNSVEDITEPIEIPAGKNVHLIGNGDEITLKAAKSLDALVDVFGTLTIETIIFDADRKGRALKVEEQGKAVVDKNAVITGGFITSNANNMQSAGGGIHNGGTLEIRDGGEVSGNTARNGGGVYNAGVLTMANAWVGENKATIAGGGVYNAGTMVMETGAVVFNNKAERAADVEINGAGGGIYNRGSLICETGSRIEHNDAGSYGGGIYTENDTKVQGGTISNNQTTGSATQRIGNCGGGVYVAAGKLQMDGGMIKENTAKSVYVAQHAGGSLGNGGGVYISNNGKNPASFVMNGGTIESNAASSMINSSISGNGGGVFVLGGKDIAESLQPGNFTMTGGTITANHASTAGAGVYMSNQEQYIRQYHQIDYEGATSFSMKGNVQISGNDTDNSYLARGVTISLTGGLSGGTVGITCESGGTTAIATGNGYTPATSDAEKFVNDTGRRTIALSGKDINLVGIDLSDSSVEPAQSSYVYTGKEIKPAVQVIASDGTVLKEGRDYTVEYTGTTRKPLVDAGTKTVTIHGGGDYAGTAKATYIIAQKDIADISAVVDTQAYTGNALMPRVTATYNSMTLLQNTDYKAEYSNNTGIGTATVDLSGIGNYTGQKSINFTIAAASLAKATMSAIADKTYTGKAFEPSVTVKLSGKTLKKGTDYAVSYENNMNAGTATVIVAGKGNYSGTASTTFVIKKAEQSITGLKASMTKAYGSKAFLLGAKAKGKLSYRSSDRKVAVANPGGKVTIKGPGKAVITVNAAAASNYNKAASKRVTITVKPKKAKVSKVSSSKEAILKVTWKKDAKATGYQVWIAQNSKFTKGKKTATIKKNKITSKTFEKLSKGKKYYAKVRAYKKIDGKKVYGAWSKAKSKKVKEISGTDKSKKES